MLIPFQQQDDAHNGYSIVRSEGDSLFVSVTHEQISDVRFALDQQNKKTWSFSDQVTEFSITDDARILRDSF
jgi:hypothetical protein